MVMAAVMMFCCPALPDPLKSVGKKPSGQRPELPEFLPEKEKKPFDLPEVPKRGHSPNAVPLFVLKGVGFEGNTLFPDTELDGVAAPFINRPVSMADLEELRYRLTKFYVDRGYPNSGALIKPGQKVDNGVVAYRIIEGRLKAVRVAGHEGLRPQYIRDRIWPDPDLPFNTPLLEERFRMLLQDPLIRRMNGKILPGTKPGEAVLDLDITREKPYDLQLLFNNHAPAGLGGEQGVLDGTLRNLTGFGDALALSLGHTGGTDEAAADFSIPLNSRDTRLTIGYTRGNNRVVEAPFDAIDVESEVEGGEVSLTHPIFRSLSRRFDIGLSLDVRESRSSLLGMPFSFSKGAVDGKSRVSALRLVNSFRHRQKAQALVLQSTLSLGLDAFGSTIHSGPDSEYLSWLGQFQYARRIGERLGQVILSGSSQFASDSLLSLEQYALGGAATVRGYRENQVVRDNGYSLSLEWRIPIWEGAARKGGTMRLQAAPFVDFARGWNKGAPGRGDEGRTLSSAGIGLLWQGPWVNAEIFWGHGFESVPSGTDYDLQDDGIHFSISVDLL